MKNMLNIHVLKFDIIIEGLHVAFELNTVGPG